MKKIIIKYRNFVDVGPTEEKTCTLNDLADIELRFRDREDDATEECCASHGRNV